MDFVKDIDVPCMAVGIGSGKLTVRHPLGTCGQPVFVADSSTTGYGPTEVTSIQPLDGETYSVEQLEYVRYHGLQVQGALAWYMEGWASSGHKCEGH